MSALKHWLRQCSRLFSPSIHFNWFGILFMARWTNWLKSPLFQGGTTGSTPVRAICFKYYEEVLCMNRHDFIMNITKVPPHVSKKNIDEIFAQYKKDIEQEKKSDLKIIFPSK